MKALFIILTLLLLAGCADVTVTPTPPDADAASARKNAYSLRVQGNKPYVINMNQANIYMWRSTDSETHSGRALAITDGELVSGSQILLSSYRNATWLILIGLNYLNDGNPQPGEFLIFKDYNVSGPITRPMVHWTTEHSGIVNPITGEPTYRVYTMAWKLNLIPDYVQHDEYMTVIGDLVHNGTVTIILDNVDAKIFSHGYGDLPTVPIGKATLNFTGVIDATRVNNHM